MALTNCSRCQYFNHNPNHQGDIVCSLNPAYAQMYRHLKSLDAYTVDCLPVDDCREFELDLAHQKKEITLSLTLAQWQQTAYESSNPSLIDALKNITISKTINLTQEQWQQIADSCTVPEVVLKLEDEGIKHRREHWIHVDSECIDAIAFDRDASTLKIQFTSGQTYQYHDFDGATYLSFLDAYSKGRFFNMHIKDVYPYQLID